MTRVPRSTASEAPPPCGGGGNGGTEYNDVGGPAAGFAGAGKTSHLLPNHRQRLILQLLRALRHPGALRHQLGGLGVALE